eukprot:5338374-Amphidinium_carterae.1
MIFRSMDPAAEHSGQELQVRVGGRWAIRRWLSLPRTDRYGYASERLWIADSDLPRGAKWTGKVKVEARIGDATERVVSQAELQLIDPKGLS